MESTTEVEDVFNQLSQLCSIGLENTEKGSISAKKCQKLQQNDAGYWNEKEEENR